MQLIYINKITLENIFSIIYPKPYKSRKIKENMENNQNQQEQTEYVRVKLPRQGDVIGIIEQRVGAGRLIIKCVDGKSRNCKVPGRLKRKLWLREGDIVIVQPWEFDDTKADVLFKYNPSQIYWLKQKGYLKTIENDF